MTLSSEAVINVLLSCGWNLVTCVGWVDALMESRMVLGLYESYTETRPVASPATNNFPSLLKDAEYTTSLNLENVLITCLVLEENICTLVEEVTAKS